MNDLIEAIYEAAVVPDRWPFVMDRLAGISGSVGGVVFADDGSEGARWAASGAVHAAFAAFNAPGRNIPNTRPAKFLARGRGFQRDVDFLSREEIDRDPLRNEWLIPSGLGWQCGAVVQSPSGETAVFSLERPDILGPHDRDTPEKLDAYLPHLARAGVLAARVGLERARMQVATLEAIGLPAAVLDAAGKSVATNALFDGFAPAVRALAHGRIGLADKRADAALRKAVGEVRQSGGRSVPVRGSAEHPPLVIHLLPISGAAQDVFTRSDALLLLTPLSPTRPPADTLLAGLFDLTPAESRLVSGLLKGRRLKEIAAESGVKISTVRTQLSAVLMKTETERQADLISLVANVGSYAPVRQAGPQD